MLRANSALFQPVRIGPLVLPNRFMRSATCEGAVESSGAPTSALLSMMTNLARGEVGLIVPGYVFPLRSGQSNRVQTGMYTESLANVWRSTIAEIHKTASKIIFQVCHAGSGSLRPSDAAPLPISASGLRPGTRVATAQDIDEVVQAFITTARRLKAAGADGIQLHAAHGFLLSEFLSPAWNHRDDRYGRDRVALVEDIAVECRRATGPDFMVSVKMNGDDCLPGGVTPEIAAQYVRRLLPAVDLFEISCGAAEACFPVRFDIALGLKVDKVTDEALRTMMRGVPFAEGYNVDATRVIRRAAPQAALAAVGAIRRLDQMQQLLDEGTADIISLSRPFLREPNLVQKLKTKGGNSDCISCGLCMVGDRPVRCHYPRSK